MNTPQEIINIVAAHSRGAVVEVQYISSSGDICWYADFSPSWDFSSNVYRIRKEVPLVIWLVRRHDCTLRTFFDGSEARTWAVAEENRNGTDGPGSLKVVKLVEENMK